MGTRSVVKKDEGESVNDIIARIEQAHPGLRCRTVTDTGTELGKLFDRQEISEIVRGAVGQDKRNRGILGDDY